MVRIAHTRHHIEQFYQEAKGELGWDDYEGRLWHGFHRHAVVVFLAYSFLVLLRPRQHRRCDAHARFNHRRGQIRLRRRVLCAATTTGARACRRRQTAQ